MKGSISVIICFVIGCLIGRYVDMPFDNHSLSISLLYILMIQVGIGIGVNPNLKILYKELKLRFLLLPIGTVGGALIISCIIGFCLKQLTVSEILAINYGCGYYSLSSILINQIMTPNIGAIIAAEIATIALLTNILRELMALFFAPLIRKYIGAFGLIGAAGVTSTDVCLPTIEKWNGESFVGLAIIHGIIIDVSTPFFVTLFCQL